jgi:hypothetical protein
VVVAGSIVSRPLNATEPSQLPTEGSADAVQDVASVDDQSRLVVPPDTVEVGDAEMKTWGAESAETTGKLNHDPIIPQKTKNITAKHKTLFPLLKGKLK